MLSSQSLLSRHKELSSLCTLMKKHTKGLARTPHWQKTVAKAKHDARVTHLALSYLKGTPYKNVETRTNQPISQHMAVSIERLLYPEGTLYGFSSVYDWLGGKEPIIAVRKEPPRIKEKRRAVATV